MNLNQIKKILPILIAYSEGKEIQYRADVESHWIHLHPINHPGHSFPDFDFEYRIKPEVKYRPWNTIYEVPVGKLVIFKKHPKTKEIILGCIELGDTKIFRIKSTYVPEGLPSDVYLDDFTMEDGSPCGIKEE